VRLEADRAAPGNGLGLSLVNAVAKLHGAKLGLADNRPGLRVHLDLAGVAAPAA
jgi:signal transduction histidine kinase